MQVNQPTATNTVTNTRSGARAKYDELPTLAYINIGKSVPKESNPDETFMVSPFYGIEIKEDARKPNLSKYERELFAAILNKVKGLEKGKVHSINLDLDIYVVDQEAVKEVDITRFADI